MKIAIIGQQDFGKAVMEAFLKADKNIDVLYAHNDQMAGHEIDVHHR